MIADAISHRLRSSKHAGLYLCLALVALAYLPVMAHVSLRPTGDEKTYISQAHEMAAAGTWFKQSFAGTPDYYKGPLFYVLLRVGFVVFGDCSPWALSYMNFAGLIVAAALVYSLCRQRLQNAGAALIATATLTLASGVFAHALAAQMEALLIVAYAVSMALVGSAAVGRAGTGRRVAAWIVIGAAGWLKSPLHSALLGSSALLYWAWRRELLGMMRRPGEWLAVAAGVATGFLGYLPAYLYDRDAFVSTYLMRETFDRTGNGVTIWDAVRPLFFEHFVPWTPLLAAGATLPARRRTPGERLFLQLAWAWMIPTIAFFVIYPGRSGIYIMPVLPSLSLLVALAWRRSFHLRRSIIRRTTLIGIASLFAVVTVAFVVVAWRFHPLPDWWGRSTDALALVGLIAGIGSFYAAAGRQRTTTSAAAWAAVGMTCLFAGLGQVFVALGTREAVEPLALSAELGPSPDGAPWYRLNLSRNLWSEWGLFNAAIGRPVESLPTLKALDEKLKPGAVLLIPDAEQYAQLKHELLRHPELSLRTHPWHRWLIHGEMPDGELGWHAAWRQRTLSPLERVETIAEVVQATHVAAEGGPGPG